MFYKLNSQFMLRGWENVPYAVVKKNGGVNFIKEIEMRALQLCNGKIDVSMPLVPKALRELLPYFEEQGVILPCKQGDGILAEQEYKRYPGRYIRRAHWSITGRCNYRCKHCYMSASEAKLGELDHDMVMSIVQQLADCGIQSVTLTGGEPLVRKDFLEIVDALLAAGICIDAIYSNGKLVTDALLEQLERRGIYPEFNISYDGIDGWHDWLRGVPDAGKIAENAFLRCKERGFPTAAEMCLHQGNKHLVRETVNCLSKLGCRSLKIGQIVSIGAWKENGAGVSLSSKELFQIFLDYIPYYYEDGMPLELQLGGMFYATPLKPKEYWLPVLMNCQCLEKTYICNHARMVMYISAEGRVLPCLPLAGLDIQQEFPLISEMGLLKCISDSRYMRLLDTRATEILEHNPECRTCKYVMQCLAGCRASALESAPDDILAPDLAACTLFKGGWVEKTKAVMEKMDPTVRCTILDSNEGHIFDK